MGIVEEGITFATNFLTQILTIIAAMIIGVRYVVMENKKSHARLAKKILGENQDGKAGLLNELRTELKEEFKRDLEDVKSELTGMISESHIEIINEFRRTSTKISYMSRDVSRIEKSLEKMSGGRYIAAKEDTLKDEYGFYDDMTNSDDKDDFTRKYRRGNKKT